MSGTTQVSAARTVVLPSADPPANMMLVWPVKNPADVEDFSLDVSAWTADTNDPVASFTAQIMDGAPSDLTQPKAKQFAGSVLTVWLGAGTSGATYFVDFQVTSVGGRTLTVRVWLTVQDTAGCSPSGAPSISGPPGASFISGTTDPSPAIGRDGDTYLNATTGWLWQRANGEWAHLANLFVAVATANDPTFTGTVTLAADPTQPLQAATKEYVDAGDAANAASAANAVALATDALSKAGGTMSGPIALHADPTAALQPATKQYVDAGVGAAQTAANSAQAAATGALPASGGTMSGPLTLAADPTQTLHAATKHYVDAEVASVEATLATVQTTADGAVPLAGGTMTGPLVLSADPAQARGAATKEYADAGDATNAAAASSASTAAATAQTAAEAAQATASAALPRAGGTMTGALVLAAAPATDLQAATKAYADAGDATNATAAAAAAAVANAALPKSGGTLTGAVTLAADPAAALQPATKQYVDGAVATANTAASAAQATANSATTVANAALPKAGGTMSGPLVLAADPTAALHPATKEYVDSADTANATSTIAAHTAAAAAQTTADAALPKAGGTMTGALVLAADPAAALQPATKQYVDTAVGTVNTAAAAAQTTATAAIPKSAIPNSALVGGGAAFMPVTLNATLQLLNDVLGVNPASFTTQAWVQAQGYLTLSTLPAAPVQSVAGRTGAVTLAYGDISGLGDLAPISHGTGLVISVGKLTVDETVIASQAWVTGLGYVTSAGATTAAQTYVQGLGYVTAAQAAVAAPVQSVAGHTGAVVLGVTDISGAAPLASPALTGTPTAPTAAVTDNSTTIATTAFIKAQAYVNAAAAAAAAPVQSVAGRTGAVALTAADIANLAGAGLALSAGSLTVDQTVIASRAYVLSLGYATATQAAAAAPVQSVAGRTGAVIVAVGDVAGAAPLSSPTFTGVPRAPTPAIADSSTAIATTSYVQGQGYTTQQQAAAAAPVQSVGGKTGAIELAVGDVAGAAPAASPVLTGTPTAPTPAAGDSSLAIATTQFVASSFATLAQAAAAAPVQSVAGRAGAVTLAVVDVSGAAPLASPALTGAPTAPTPAANDNSTNVATTAFVQTMLGGYVPSAKANAASGFLALDANKNASFPAFRLDLVADGIALNGTGQTNGTALAAQHNIATSGTGDAVLPAAAVFAHGEVTFLNRTTAAKTIWPASGEQIEALGANASVAVDVNGNIRFVRANGGPWRMM